MVFKLEFANCSLQVNFLMLFNEESSVISSSHGLKKKKKD